MSQATIEKSVEADELPVTRHGADPKGRAITRAVLAIGFVVLVALALLLVFTTSTEESARTTIGFSLNSFFVALGGMHPLVQIPVILAVFGVVVAIILVLIEFAPRPGRGYFIMRLVACLVIPVLAFLLLRPYQNAVLYVVAIALLVGALLFFADFRARQEPATSSSSCSSWHPPRSCSSWA